MNIQVLVAAMNQSDRSLLEKMNIKTDVIVGNQCDRNSVEHFEFDGHRATYLNFAERGVGLNRNNALMRADGDICLFADDDMVYSDDYAEKVAKAFEDNPRADIIVFNLAEKNGERYIIKKKHRVGRHNYLRYGAARIAVRLARVREKTIYFNQLFGGGTEHSHGEDTIFLTDCLSAGLKIYAVPEFIAELTEERSSTWFEGYTDKYFIDKGILLRHISPRLHGLFALLLALKHRRGYKKFGVKKALRLMIYGK